MTSEKSFRGSIGRFGIPVIASLVLLLPSSGAVLGQEEPAIDTDVFSIARGGQYYDKWWTVIDADEPDGTHPAYPAEGQQTGSATWRCKECHGWDYKGADGAYGSGSHYSGVRGIGGMANGNLEKIAEILRGPPHDYDGLLPDRAIERLALFVSAGQIDMDDYIDRTTKKAKGSPTRGARIYQTVCANCHGFDGRLLNFGDADDPEFIGTVAQANPWETLHKIRMGQPGQPMPALIALDIQDLVDITAYAQTLPAD